MKYNLNIAKRLYKTSKQLHAFAFYVMYINSSLCFASERKLKIGWWRGERKKWFEKWLINWCSTRQVQSI